MKPLFVLAVAAALCAGAQRSGAQVVSIDGRMSSEWRAGAVMGAGINRHIIAEPVFDTSRSPLIVPPEGTGFELGLTAEFRFNDRLGVMGDLMYIDRSGQSTQLLPEPIAWLDDAKTGPHAMFAEHDVRYTLLSMEILGTWRFARFDDDLDMAIAAGPAYSIVMADNLWQAIDVGYDRQPPPGDSSGRSGQIYVVRDGDIAGAPGSRVSFMLGLFADISAGDFHVVPGAYYDFGLNDLTTLSDWKLSSLDLRLAVRWDL